MIRKIIHLDVFHFHFEVELDNCKYDFLIKVHKLRCGGRINLTKMTSKTGFLLKKVTNSGIMISGFGNVSGSGTEKVSGEDLYYIIQEGRNRK